MKWYGTKGLLLFNRSERTVDQRTTEGLLIVSFKLRLLERMRVEELRGRAFCEKLGYFTYLRMEEVSGCRCRMEEGNFFQSLDVVYNSVA